MNNAELVLLGSVVAVGVLHTMVPDHWAPIALLARQRGWSRAQTARAALVAGGGHVVTTLLFGLAIWLIGAAAAEKFGGVVDALASLALIGFGGWIAIGAWREIRAEQAGCHSHGGSDGHHHHHHGHDHSHHHHDHHHDDEAAAWTRDPLYAPGGMIVAERHAHWHRHGEGAAHFHWHEHSPATAHVLSSDMALDPPLHLHRHRTTGRTAMLLILGSSPMVEGIPAFFAASRYGLGLVVAMGLAFAASTIATYVLLSVSSASGLQRLSLGPLERYGEVLSGAVIVAIGIVFGFFTLF